VKLKAWFESEQKETKAKQETKGVTDSHNQISKISLHQTSQGVVFIR